MKDNIAYGETDWDIIANDWDADKLTDWGMDLPDGWGAAEEKDEKSKSDTYVCKIEFADGESLERFRDAYRSTLEADYNCIVK